jgi:hypothetical protein
MNSARICKHIFATILIVIYLTVPVSNLAFGANLEKTPPAVQALAEIAATAPCDDCPCSDGPGSTCCDTSFCTCACHAPLSQSLQLVYAPVIVLQRFLEPSWSLPQVFRSIYVPPQNLA